MTTLVDSRTFVNKNSFYPTGERFQTPALILNCTYFNIPDTNFWDSNSLEQIDCPIKPVWWQVSVIGQVKADSLGLKQSIKPQKKAGRESFIFKYIVVITITKKIAMGITTFF